MPQEIQSDWLRLFSPKPSAVVAPTEVPGPDRILFRRSSRARHYRLTLERDGTAIAVIPRRGSHREAERFVAQHSAWLERARERQRRQPRLPATWLPGTRVLWRGELEEIRLASAPGASRTCVSLAADVFAVASAARDLRPALEAHFFRQARVELPARTWELAAVTDTEVHQVTVRNQRTLWGSCSRSGTISLNWRLVQAPESVRDYIILHELMHRREMNHSPRFWAEVGEVCPDWRESEDWINQNSSLLGMG